MKDSRKVLPDIIRIILTAAVLFHHYQQLTGTFFYRGINFYGGKIYFGYIVEAFFLMSGFFMVPYIAKIQDKMSFPEFYGKRLIRLIPSMIVSVILYDVFLYVFVNFADGHIRYPEKINVFGSIITALGMGNWCITKDFEINAVSWYVSVLLLCYIVMYVLTFISKKTKIPVAILFLIPMAAGVIRIYGMEFSNIPFFNPRIGRGYIHFFGGLQLGIIFVGLFGKSRKANEIAKNKLKENKNKVKPGFGYLLKNAINKIGEATLDIYLIQLPVLLVFFIISYYTGLNLVSGKTMLLYAASTFIIGGLYYFLIGKQIHSWLSKLFTKKKQAV